VILWKVDPFPLDFLVHMTLQEQICLPLPSLRWLRLPVFWAVATWNGRDSHNKMVPGFKNGRSIANSSLLCRHLAGHLGCLGSKCFTLPANLKVVPEEEAMQIQWWRPLECGGTFLLTQKIQWRTND
jgi:hypothetical protein